MTVVAPGTHYYILRLYEVFYVVQNNVKQRLRRQKRRKIPHDVSRRFGCRGPSVRRALQRTICVVRKDVKYVFYDYVSLGRTQFYVVGEITCLGRRKLAIYTWRPKGGTFFQFFPLIILTKFLFLTSTNTGTTHFSFAACLPIALL